MEGGYNFYTLWVLWDLIQDVLNFILFNSMSQGNITPHFHNVKLHGN